MSAMYEAMKKAAEKNPEFAAELDRAVKANEDRRAKEDEDRRIKAAADYQAKVLRQQREAQEKERTRRAKEINLLGNPRIYPFGFSYPFMGQYSACYGIVFADVSDNAREMVVKLIKERFESYNNDHECVKKDEQYALDHIFVWQLDLADGICTIGEYYE